MNSIVKLLEFRAGVWPSLIADLCKRGKGYRESGAFLLGQLGADTKSVHAWLPYDKLDPGALDLGYIRLATGAFERLWSECERYNLQVVADVHTHPREPTQSRSDRANPMIAMSGHTAIIVPRFAQGDVVPRDVSVNIYLGAKRWSSHFGPQADALIKLP